MLGEVEPDDQVNDRCNSCGRFSGRQASATTDVETKMEDTHGKTNMEDTHGGPIWTTHMEDTHVKTNNACEDQRAKRTP